MNHKIVIMALCVASFLGISQESRAQSAPGASKNMPPIIAQMLSAINSARDGKQAQENLCKQGGVIRGSGLSAGENCRGQDFGRIIAVICKGYTGFESSKCWNNVKGSIAADKAAEFLSNAVGAGYERPNIASALVCTPKRDKLPAGLRSIADQQCRAEEALKERSVNVIVQSALRDLPQRDVILNTEKGLFYLEAAKDGMRVYREEAAKLSGAGKVAPVAGIKQMAPAQLIMKADKAEEAANLALVKVKTTIEAPKSTEQKVAELTKTIGELEQANKALEDLEREFNQKYLEEQQIKAKSEAKFKQATAR